MKKVIASKALAAFVNDTDKKLTVSVLLYFIIHALETRDVVKASMIAIGDGGKLVVEFRSMDSTEEPIATINLRDEYLDLFTIAEKDQDKQLFIAELRSLADELEAK